MNFINEHQMTLGLLAPQCICVCVCLSLPSPVTNVSYAAAGSSINNNMMFIYWAGGVTFVWADGWTGGVCVRVCECVHACECVCSCVCCSPSPCLHTVAGGQLSFIWDNCVDLNVWAPIHTHRAPEATVTFSRSTPQSLITGLCSVVADLRLPHAEWVGVFGHITSGNNNSTAVLLSEWAGFDSRMSGSSWEMQDADGVLGGNWGSCPNPWGPKTTILSS